MVSRLNYDKCMRIWVLKNLYDNLKHALHSPPDKKTLLLQASC